MSEADLDPKALAGSEAVFFCVGTPSGEDGRADLRYLEAAMSEVLDAMGEPAIGEGASGRPVLVVKSTVPPGTAAGPKAGARGGPA